MNPSTAQATVIVDELVRCGVTDAVLCPGSRNAPLAFALAAADTRRALRLHVRIDERTAGFLALGLARRSGRPVPVCSTSGTAVANLHPAVLEASHTGVPLLVLTADRPPQLLGTGANQTVEQAGIFGDAVRLARTAAVAADVDAENGRWRSLVDRAAAAALGSLGGPPGPVHLNLPFAEPLVPDPAAGAAGRGVVTGGAPWTALPHVRGLAPASVPNPHGESADPARRVRGSGTASRRIRHDPLPLDPAAPTLVIAGDGAPAELADLGVPIVAEPSSPLWPAAVRTGPWLLAAAGLRPAQVLVAGRPTLHRPVQRLLADPAVAVHAVADPAGRWWPDVAGTVRAVGSVPTLRPDPAWGDRWTRADRAAAAELDRLLDSPQAPGGLRLARAVTAALPDGALLVLGSSNPVRDVALAAAPRTGLTVLANRGVAGIDGTVSTAVGAALAHGGPAYLLLGDLTLLHDTTGLVIGPDEPRPDLAVIVLNDRGGGIFTLLEQGAPDHAATFERAFGTPHSVDLRALAEAVGLGFRRVPAEHAPAIAADLVPRPGMRLVEVPADRAELRAGHARLRAAIADVLGRPGQWPGADDAVADRP
ncbi:MAG TPA: 2-succinyl-5-enolpyruvyl-6-hydroxy-3-cyclohexene-1-carboxylic-acid synthase [Pseudonocardia sp.]|nr:2-succinyl-5-enolpyruvyl-6-hydroxy-3-cyclohexene-1-carboxylic-acid synthase [Pseudonocardia sp.]